MLTLHFSLFYRGDQIRESGVQKLAHEVPGLRRAAWERRWVSKVRLTLPWRGGTLRWVEEGGVAGFIRHRFGV
ncbi:hypothetical protein GCM10010245_66810 [Streptomyces spectabilis]|nr:hypothetical protein GCM10010245_66810 [Streptomyces spectabilis]